MKFGWLLFIVTLGIACVVFTVSAQNQEQKQTTAPPVSADDFQKAHQTVFGSETDKAAEASRLTNSFAAAGSGIVGNVARKNYVDEAIFGRMDRDKIAHAPLASDQEFVRRLYLDATGLLPTPAQVREFVASNDANKRDKLIDSLVGSDDFADQWAWFWADLFQARNESFAYWFKQNLKADRPYNEIFGELVASPATKNASMIPTWAIYSQSLYNALRATTATDPDNYYYANRLDWIDESTVNLGRVFLGINMDCFSCHDAAGHTDSINLFLTTKKRSDFHQQAAFFGKVRPIATWSDRSKMPSSAQDVIDDLAPGYKTDNDAPFYTMAEGRFPRKPATYEPAFILTGEKPRPGMNPRQELARIAPTHIQFSRAAVNLVWGKLMVVGFVEPYDGFDLLRLDPNNPPPKPWTIQPTNPQLLDAMAKDFQANNYSLQHLFKTIMKSSAYQLSTQYPAEWKDAYVPYYARRFVRVLTGPEVADALAQVTGNLFSFNLKGQTVTRVKQLSNPTGLRGGSAGRNNDAARLASVTPQRGNDGTAVSALMQAFFQSGRETPPAAANRASAVQAMMMMNSPAVTNRLRPETGLLQQLLKSGKSDPEVIEELFLTALSRTPTKEEVEVAQRVLQSNRNQGASDILWALLNTPEFLLNY
jgi:hypothetical protein